MNELLLRHGCCTVFSLPPGLKELMSDISREVLREQPAEIYDFITNYLSALLITREHGVLAVKILDDLCDCRPSLMEHLQQIGFKYKKSSRIAELVQTEIEEFEPTIGNEKFVEAIILKKVLELFRNIPTDEQIAKLLQVIRNAYKDYWYRKNLMAQHILNKEPLETWEQAVENTLNIYKKTKPSLAQLHRASLKIQTAYRGYYIRRQMTKAPKFEIPHKIDTRPLDIAESREMDLGPFLRMIPKDDTSRAMLEAHRQNVKYEPLHAIDYRPDRPEPESTVLRTGSEETELSRRTSEFLDDAAAERDLEMEREQESGPADYETHKKISFAGVTLKDTEGETESTANVMLEMPHEEIPEEIAAGVVADVIKAIPTDFLEQSPDHGTDAEQDQENIPEQITENGPNQEADILQEEVTDTVPEQITENLPDQETDNAQEVPEQITEPVAEQAETDADQGTEVIPEQIAETSLETVPAQGTEVIQEQITQSAPENTGASKDVPDESTNQANRDDAFDDPTVDIQSMTKPKGQGQVGLDDHDPTMDYADHKPINIHDLAPDMVDQETNADHN